MMGGCIRNRYRIAGCIVVGALLLNVALIVYEFFYDPLPKSTEIALAIDHYMAQKGHPPDTLDDLRPEFYDGSLSLGFYEFSRLKYERHGAGFNLEIETGGSTGYYRTNESEDGWGFYD